MTIQQEAIVRARVMLIRAKDVLKAAEAMDEESEEFWKWAEENECEFDVQEGLEYTRLYKETKAAIKKTEEILKR